MPTVPPDDRLELLRELHQLRRPLPMRHAAPAPPDRTTLRAFRPGSDDSNWLEVNNRAFAWHPEQGGWDAERLARVTAEPWFDPEGFLVAERDGRIIGFCWTKVHTGEDPPVGEIFVIGVDPDKQTAGLGEVLVTAGLDHLAGAGLTTAMLYVESDNEAAQGLYAKLGFELHELQRWYRPR